MNIDSTLAVLNTVLKKILSPLALSFLVAWLLWNYEVTLSLIYADKLDTIYEQINTSLNRLNNNFNNTYYLGNGPRFLNSYLIPFILGVSYLFLYPIAFYPIERYSYTVKDYYKRMRVHFLDIAIITEEERDKIYKDQEKLRDEYMRRVDTLRTENETNEGMLNKRTNQVDQLRKLLKECEEKQTKDDDNSEPQTIDELGATKEEKEKIRFDRLSDIQKDIIIELGLNEISVGKDMTDVYMLESINLRVTKGALAEPTYNIITLRVGLTELVQRKYVLENLSKHPTFYQLGALGRKAYEYFIRDKSD